MVLIDVRDEAVLRLSGASHLRRDGHVFHIEFNPPKVEGICDVDGCELIVRDDDKPDVILHRLEQYHAKTSPLIDYYKSQGSCARSTDRGAGRGRRNHRTLATLSLEADEAI